MPSIACMMPCLSQSIIHQHSDPDSAIRPCPPSTWAIDHCTSLETFWVPMLKTSSQPLPGCHVPSPSHASASLGRPPDPVSRNSPCRTSMHQVQESQFTQWSKSLSDQNRLQSLQPNSGCNRNCTAVSQSPSKRGLWPLPLTCLRGTSWPSLIKRLSCVGTCYISCS